MSLPKVILFFIVNKSMTSSKKPRAVEVDELDDDELDRLLSQSVLNQSKINRSMMSSPSKRSRRPLTFAE